MRWEDTIEIDATPERVWQLTLDVESLPAISPMTMTTTERRDPGELRPGSRVRIKQPKQRARVWTVTRADAPRLFVWETALRPMRMIATHLIEPTPAGCRQTLRLDLTGPGSGLLGRLIGHQLAMVLATENAGFKRVAERSVEP